VLTQDATPLDFLIQYWNGQGLAESTIRNYRRTLIDSRALDGGSSEEIRDYLARFPNPRTRATKRVVIRNACRLAIALGVLEDDPSVLVGKIRVPRSTPRPFTRAELAHLESSIREPAKTYLVLAAYAGLRACEIAQVSFADLESYPGGWLLRVVGKGSHEAVIPAHAKVVEALAAWERPEGLTANRVSQACGREFRRVGVAGGIHRARHSYGTRVYAASGHDLLVTRDLLRHASVATTQIYTAIENDRSAVVVGLL